MKKLLWTSALALTAMACLTACDESGTDSGLSIAEYKTASALPDTCSMEVAKVDTTYFACQENKWIEVTDSATVEKIKEGLDEDELKEQLEELEEQLQEAAAEAKKPSSSSSKKVESSADKASVEPESSASEEECTGRRCKDKSSSSKKKDSSSGSGSTTPSSTGSAGSGSGSSTGSAGSGSGSSTGSAGSGSGSSTGSAGSGSGSSSSGTESAGSGSGSSTSTDVGCYLVKINSYTASKKIDLVKAVKNQTGIGLAEAKYTLDHVPSYAIATANKTQADAMQAALVAEDADVSLSVETADKCPALCAGISYDETKAMCDARAPFIVYKTTVISGQTWMAENLNHSTSGSYCYEDESSNCAKYGRLYTWYAAVGSTEEDCGSTECDLGTGDVQGVCPTGWHIPNETEITSLKSLGSALFDADGFNAQKAGYYYPGVGGEGAYYSGIGTYAGIWSTKQTATDGYRFMMISDYGGNPKNYRNSVRCVKDDE